MYLTQFAFQEAKHVEVFRRWLGAVGVTTDLSGYAATPAYQRIFAEELPASLEALTADPSPAAQVRASVTYHHVAKGMLVLTGYYG